MFPAGKSKIAVCFNIVFPILLWLCLFGQDNLWIFDRIGYR